MTAASKCPHCGFVHAADTRECMSCGRALSSDGEPSPLRALPSTSLIRRFFTDVRTILTRPTAYFRRIPLSGGISGPLAFALVCHWLGTALSYLASLVFGGGLARRFDEAIRSFEALPEIESLGKGAPYQMLRDGLKDWAFGVGSVITDPFSTALIILVTAFLVWIGARLLISPGRDGSPRNIDYESAVRIVSYGMTASLFRGIPFIGGFLASLGTWIITVIATREVYRISTGRALIVGLFPQVLFFGFIAAGLFAILLLMFGLFATWMG